MARPIKASRQLKKCLHCNSEMVKPKTTSWPRYQNEKKFCSAKCGALNQFKNGMSDEHRAAIGNGQKGKPTWNSGTATIKECINCGNEYKAIGKRKLTSKYCSMQCRVEFAYTKETDIDKLEYYKAVHKITESQSLELLDGYDESKRTRIDINENAYHIDHIIPIIYGYENNIPPEEMGNRKNLQFIPAIENHKKSKSYVK